MPASYILPQASIENPNREYIQSNGIALEHYNNYDVYVIGDVANTDTVYGCQINGGVDYLSRSPNQAFWARHTNARKYILDSSTLVDDIPVYYYLSGNSPADSADFTQNFSSIQEAAEYVYHLGILYPITYRPTNCSFPNAPTEAAVGDTVVVPVTFPEGYGLANPNDLFVQCNGVLVPSTYENGQLTFTMPDPS